MAYPDGWLVVNDLFVVRPVSDEGRRAGYDRVPRVGAGVGTILRTATCISGKVDVVAMCLPMFDYGSTPCTWSYDGDSYHSLAVRQPDGEVALSLHSSFQLGEVGARAYVRSTLKEGESGFIALTWSGPPPTTQQEADADLESTVSFWREWLSTGKFPDHPWRPYLERSALTLKGLSYAPSGAIMAASTTGLPETPGGARNWDYRYTWIRDTGFTLRALYRLGYDWEALEYFAFILGALQGKDTEKPFTELQIMYGIGGERDLTEKTIDHLSGWRDSKPVRVGNGAWNQHQNDVWGMLMDAVDSHLHRGADQIIEPVWEGLAGFVEDAIHHAGDADQGIWEIRGEPQHFTQSAVMCWLAADRGADLARERGDSERADPMAAIGRRDEGRDPRQGRRRAGAVPPGVRERRTRRLAAAAPHHGVPAARRRARQGHGAGHRRRADRGRPRPSLQGRQHRHRIRGQGGDLHDLLVVAGKRLGHDRRDRPRPRPVQETPVLRGPAGAVRRGNRHLDR